MYSPNQGFLKNCSSIKKGVAFFFYRVSAIVVYHEYIIFPKRITSNAFNGSRSPLTHIIMTTISNMIAVFHLITARDFITHSVLRFEVFLK